MLAKIFTAALIGLDAKIIETEVDVFRGERRISIVGLPDKAVKESKERVVSAFKNSGILLGPGNKIINLAPADLPKVGPAYDLPIAVGLLVASGLIPKFDPEGKLFIGELSLNGHVRPVKGILAIIDSIKQYGFKEIFLSKENYLEARLVNNIKCYPVQNLIDIVKHFSGKRINSEMTVNYKKTRKRQFDFDFANIKGQYKAKRALEIAAAGGHNVLFIGPPGSGKSLLAKSFPSILPDMTYEESIEVTRIYSIAGKLDSDNIVITERPFRSPHHSASLSAIIGGGTIPRPGEISLAHRGVLFLDEFTEFSQEILEALRQPLEDKKVTISRAATSVSFPCGFQLIAAMNPCPCGYFGDNNKNCTCNEFTIARYRKKISGPILDRIDLYLHVPRLRYDVLSDETQAESSQEIRKRIQKARDIQNFRYKDLKNLANKIFNNSDLPQQNFKENLQLNQQAKALMIKAIKVLNLSARSYFKILKVARTIADLEGRTNISRKHISEALSFRMEFQR